MADTVSVTQADRDAAKKLWDCMLASQPIVTAEQGRALGRMMLQTFAEHRLASTQPAPAFPREGVARLREALEAILDLETQPIHVGYDHGAGGGNYVYEDFVSADAAFGLARAALLQGKQP